MDRSRGQLCEEGAASQGLRAAPRSCKSQGTGLCPLSLREEPALPAAGPKARCERTQVSSDPLSPWRL